MLKSYNHTRAACYFGYVTQGIVNNFSPLLFLIFQRQFEISLTQVTLLVTVNFAVQLLVDCAFSKLADKIGYRVCLVGAHFVAALGLAGLSFLPRALPSALAGLLICTVLCALGSGLIEVLVSPTVEACPSENKTGQMSLLHSFYCWGSAAVVLVSTGFLLLFGNVNWWILALVWACLPLANAVYFLFVPIAKLDDEGETLPVRKLLKKPRFWLFFVLMTLAGAAELYISQWASAFAESGLGLGKALGDMAGPCLFAVFMGLSRVLYSRYGKRLRLFLILSGIMCIGCYLVAAFVPVPGVALVGCALAGFAVGIMWPGIFSLASKDLAGGTPMFALLALGGDLGCTAGPTLVGLLAGRFNDNIGTGIAFALVFPALFVILLLCFGGSPKRKEK